MCEITATIAARVRYSRCLYDAKKCRKLAELAKKYPSVQGSSYLLLRKAETIQILALAAHIPAENQIKGAANRYSVSMDLKYGQRVCDFRSFFFALEEKLGLKEAQGLPFLQDERVDIPIETIITDWSELDEGE
ncbi:hypothetical protein E5D57_000923 [Metarhizium anisopliae]|nr:hypothetical protein E5D57_000923 [Metarhizium anisopliae]